MDTEPAHSISKRRRVGEGRPTLYTRELANRRADHIAAGLTDEEARRRTPTFAAARSRSSLLDFDERSDRYRGIKPSGGSLRQADAAVGRWVARQSAHVKAKIGARQPQKERHLGRI
jgi:hypothetical protein